MELRELPAGVEIFDVSSGADDRGEGVVLVKPGYTSGKRFTAEQVAVLSSRRFVLRGLHLSLGAGNTKLVTCLEGSIFEVVVDCRESCVSFGGWFGLTLTGDERAGIRIPPGVAHGFATTSESSVVAISVDEVVDEVAIDALDPNLGIAWPAVRCAADVIRSDRDTKAADFASIVRERGSGSGSRIAGTGS